MFIAEKAFYAENNYYTYCLYQAGYLPEGSRRIYYTGFVGANTGCQNCAFYDAGQSVPCSFVSQAWSGSTRNDAAFEMNIWANSALAHLGINGQSFIIPDMNHFNVVAFGSASSYSPIFDMWTIDETRNMVNTQPGL